MIFRPLLVRILDYTQLFSTQSLMELVVTMHPAASVLEVSFLSEKNLYIIITMSCFPISVFDRGLSASITTNCDGSIGEENEL